MPRQIQDSVIVITGASSGIGRAAALAFAERGANVVLAARRDHLLEEVARECENKGSRALAVPTDVTDPQAVQGLARRAVEHFGHLDVWVNNAGVNLLGRFEEVPDEDFRRVIEVNLFGAVNGARAALPLFLQQGSGVLINNISVAGKTGQPYASAYATSKAALDGFSQSLRMELFDTEDIHLCMVVPYAIDTPLFQHAGNYSGKAAQALKPTYNPEQVAQTMVSLAENPRREEIVGGYGKYAVFAHRLAPDLYERIEQKGVKRKQFQDKPASPTDGALFEPMAEGTGIHGGWKDGGSSQNLMMAGLAAAALVGVAWRMRH